MAISTTSTETIVKDSDGHIISAEITTDSKNIHKSEEGDFVKIYLQAFNNLPSGLTVQAFICLLHLCKYLSYADINDLKGGMLIQLTPPIREEVQARLNIKKRAFYKDLKNLTDCNLIKEVGKSCYQVNPEFIGKGYYEYKPTYKQGGIKDIRQTWRESFAEKTITVDDNSYVVSEVWQEIKKLRAQLYNEKNPVEREYLQHQIDSFLAEVKKVSQAEYTKCVKYAVAAVTDNLEQEETLNQEETTEQEETYYTIGADPFDMNDSEPEESFEFEMDEYEEPETIPFTGKGYMGNLTFIYNPDDPFGLFEEKDTCEKADYVSSINLI